MSRRVRKPVPGRVRRKPATRPVKVQIEYVPIGTVRPYPGNPRINQDTVASLANSISTFGFLIPIIVDSSGVIAAGHTRLLAAKKLKMREIPVIRANNLTPEQIAQFRIIDNKIAESSDWDMDLLAAEINSLLGTGIDFTDFGFNREELDCLTDMVSDDCLSAGASVRGEERIASTGGTSKTRGPATTRFVFGEIVFFVPSEAYRQWVNDIRTAADFQEEEVIADIKGRLGLPVGSDM